MVTCREGDHDGYELSLRSAYTWERIVANRWEWLSVRASFRPRFASPRLCNEQEGKTDQQMSLFQHETSFFCHRILVVLSRWARG